MPRKHEPSFELKRIIWDIAATIGTENYSAIQREVDITLRQYHKNEDLYEDETPDIRTLHRIIEEDIQNLTQDVVIAKLCSHIWCLREDHEAIKKIVESSAKEQKATAQMDHISSLQALVREFLDSLKYPSDTNDFNDVEQAHNSYWQAFRRLVGDARWPMLAAHLGAPGDEFFEMVELLEPEEIKARRQNPTSNHVIWISINDLLENIKEANKLIDYSNVDLIAESSDTEEWETYELQRYCPWCVV